MKNFSIAVAFCNQTDSLKDMLKSCSDTCIKDHEFILLDNGSTETYDIKLEPSCFKHRIIRNPVNEGIIIPYNQIIRNSEAEWIGFFHSDIIIHELEWDERIIDTVTGLEKKGKKIGMVGFAGSRGGDNIGTRIGFASNLRDVAEIHGKRITGWMPAVFLDGSVMICKKEMLEKIGWFDQAYKFHHLYDYDMSMASISAGYFNLVIGIDFTHKGGITACREDAQKRFQNVVFLDSVLAEHYKKILTINEKATPEMAIMDYNIQVFRKKWVGKKYLPLYFNDNFELVKE